MPYINVKTNVKVSPEKEVALKLIYWGIDYITTNILE